MHSLHYFSYLHTWGYAATEACSTHPRKRQVPPIRVPALSTMCLIFLCLQAHCSEVSVVLVLGDFRGR